MTNAGRRMKGPKDSDARSVMADFKAAQAEKRIGREVAVVRRQVERARAHFSSFEFEKEVGRKVFLGYAPAPKPIPASLEWTPVARGTPKKAGTVSLLFRRDDRIHLAGRNGAGKTTLIRALLAASAVPEERVMYLPQELSPSDGAVLLQRVRALPADVRGLALSMVAALGVDPERLLASDSPSPGEVRKLHMAEGLARHVWALVLDEPTNHLDLPSVERLEVALANFPGALLLVTHDDAPARRTCRTRWSLEDGELIVSSLEVDNRGIHPASNTR
jgi:ATPase subunit of ABC transporter with duplicated ATPase domains